MSVNGMVRPCSCPASKRSWQGAPKTRSTPFLDSAITTTRASRSTRDEKPRLVRDLGDKNFLMLRNHGLLTAAASIADAFAFMYFFEASCMIQVRAQSGGSELIPIPQPVLDGFRMAANKATGGAGPGTLAWPALLRKLDRLDPSFRD